MVLSIAVCIANIDDDSSCVHKLGGFFYAEVSKLVHCCSWPCLPLKWHLLCAVRAASAATVVVWFLYCSPLKWLVRGCRSSSGRHRRGTYCVLYERLGRDQGPGAGNSRGQGLEGEQLQR